MNITLIPVFDRPEFLKECLEFIKRADGADNQMYLFAAEYKTPEETFKVIKTFPFKHWIIRSTKRLGVGNNANVLEGYRFALEAALKMCASIVHMIEDDIFIAKDFFTFHDQAHREFNYFAVSACKNQYELPPIDCNSPRAVWVSDKYQSLGVSFPLSSLVKIVKHGNTFYYDEPERYMQSVFPNSKFTVNYSAQSGLIQRVMENIDGRCLYPVTPRAVHAGTYGMNVNTFKPESEEHKIGEVVYQASCSERLLNSETRNVDKLLLI